jgi:G:T-mismatch repair DNA endonuclease (very short patch repair protein)
MILEEETFEAFGYYPSDLKPHSNKHILAACNDCGKTRKTSKNKYYPLCSSCCKKGKNHADIKGAKNPNWKGGVVKRICQQCENPFYVWPCNIRNGSGKYCSRSCLAKARRHNAHPKMTAPEKAFMNICKKYLFPFKFVGNGALWLGNANPDFVHNTKKIVVEVFGDYWHSPLLRNVRYNETLNGRRKQLKVEGYKLIVLWESDLNREDAEAFVIHLLKKEKII